MPTLNRDRDQALERIADAIRAYDRLMAPDRQSNEIMTHWLVGYSFTRVSDEGPHDDMDQINTIPSPSLSWWAQAGMADAIRFHLNFRSALSIMDDDD